MWSILFRAADVPDEDALIFELWERGIAGIVEEKDGLRAFFEDSVAPASMADSGSEIRTELSETRPAERADWDPILIGERFYLAPASVADAAFSSRLRLEIDDCTAFGTGRHETTQLCIEALERYLRPGDTVLDVGSGSGILSVAAKLLGADKVFSCDIHQDAIDTTRRHLGAPVFFGSADAVQGSLADIVAANISAKVLDRLAFELKRITKPGGLLALAGFVHDNPPQRFRPEEILEQGDWSCWLCRPEGIDVTGMNEAGEELVHEAEWWL